MKHWKILSQRDGYRQDDDGEAVYLDTPERLYVYSLSRRRLVWYQDDKMGVYYVDELPDPTVEALEKFTACAEAV